MSCVHVYMFYMCMFIWDGIYFLTFHRSIATQNLLLGEDGLVKIADFGISQMLSASGQKLADAAGTPAFMSPELCEGKSFSGQLADIWAIGATMFMLRFGHPPFLAKSIIHLYSKICNDPLVFPAPIDPGLKNLLENLLEKDPNKRYTLQQIIMHPWFRHPPTVHAQQLHMRCPPSATPTIVNPYSGPPAAAHMHANLARVPAGAAGAAAAVSAGAENAAGGSHASDKDKQGELKSASLLVQSVRRLQTSITFRPPDSYEAEEAAAMEGPQVKVEEDGDEIFMSIGGIKPRPAKTGSNNSGGSAAHSHAGADGKIDEEDGDTGGGKGTAYSSDVEVDSDAGGGGGGGGGDVVDMMNTDWGADVFQMVDDGENSDCDDSVDEDSVDDDADAKSSKSPSKKRVGGGGGGAMASGKKSTNSSEGSMGAMMLTATRNEMSQEEEAKRARRFMSKITKKSNEDMALATNPGAASASSAAAVGGKGISNRIDRDRDNGSSPSHSNSSNASMAGGVNSSTGAAIAAARKMGASTSSPDRLKGIQTASNDSFDALPYTSSAASSPSKSYKHPFKAVSTKGAGGAAARTRDSSIRFSSTSDVGDDEATDPLSMEDFNSMMDTLAMQPKKFSDLADEADGNGLPAGGAGGGGIGGLLPIDGFSAELTNKKNGVAAAFNSEKGCRHTQEDRCVLLPNAAQMKCLEEARLDSSKMEQMKHFTIACVFDGHSGWRCAQYLSQHFAPMLVLHEKFLVDKQIDNVLIEVCANIDEKVKFVFLLVVMVAFIKIKLHESSV